MSGKSSTKKPNVHRSFVQLFIGCFQKRNMRLSCIQSLSKKLLGPLQKITHADKSRFESKIWNTQKASNGDFPVLRRLAAWIKSAKGNDIGVRTGCASSVEFLPDLALTDNHFFSTIVESYF